jgi:hypothetical protein
LDDPLSLAALGGSALTQAFGFVFGQLEAVLERKRADKDPRIIEDEPITLEQPLILAGRLAPLTIDQASLHEHAAELLLLRNLLANYCERNELNAADKALIQMLSRAREILEDVYGQSISFQGEDHPRTGTRIQQRIKDAHGKTVGLEVREFSQGEARVSQVIDTVHKGGEIIGGRFDRLG